VVSRALYNWLAGAAASIQTSEVCRIPVTKPNPIRTRRTEKGIALLISIFILLLISVMAIALIVASGTESALAGNYRSSTGVYYAALAGLEEARGRLALKNPNAFQNTNPGFFPGPGNTLTIGNILYVLNPSPTENAANILTTYQDTDYNNEFGPNKLASATITTTSSVWNTAPLNGLGVTGPLYKWVRINPVSEQSLGIDTSPYDGTIDPTPVYYDGANLNDRNNGGQVLEITSLAALPNGSEKMVQYLVAPNSGIFVPFPAAVTLLGNNVDYTGPNSGTWFVNGNDTITLGNCNPGASVYAVGYYNGSDSSRSNIDTGTFTGHATNYTGQGGFTPNLGNISGSIPASLQKPSQLDALGTSITQIADVVITPTPPSTSIDGSQLSAATPSMSSSNPITVVVNGDLDLTSWHNTGYGLLLVTGTLTYDPDASWYGAVVLIGQASMVGSRAGSGKFVGGMFLAKTRDASGNLFPDPNLPSNSGSGFTPPDPRAYGSNIELTPTMGGSGVYYSSCWIKAALPTGNYTVLSFHEISQ